VPIRFQTGGVAVGQEKTAAEKWLNSVRPSVSVQNMVQNNCPSVCRIKVPQSLTAEHFYRAAWNADAV